MWPPTFRGIGNGRPSTWSFDTSEGSEFDALFVATGKGSFYIKDSRDPDQIVHEILYVGLGVTKSKGPIPFGIGGSFSTPDMWSMGVGNIVMQAGRTSLALADFGGVGLIVVGSISAGFLPDLADPGKGILEGCGADLVQFGGIVNAKATGVILSKQRAPEGAGITIMPCIFTIDP